MLRLQIYDLDMCSIISQGNIWLVNNFGYEVIIMVKYVKNKNSNNSHNSNINIKNIL